MTAEQWAEVNAIDLGAMSDPESAATAAHFIAKVAKKPGSKEEVAAFSKAGRSCPDILNRAVASVDRDRARHTKSLARIASIESRWREERSKSVKQEARIMRLQQRVEELEKENQEVRAAHRAAQNGKDEEVAKVVGRAKKAKEATDRVHAKQVQDLKNQVRNVKLKSEVAKTTYRSYKSLLETENAKYKEKLQTAEDAAKATDDVHSSKISALKDKVAAMEAEADVKERKLAESEASAASLRVKLVKAQLKVRAADLRDHELRRAREEVDRYERHCRRMAEMYGGQIIIRAYEESASSGGPAAVEAQAQDGAVSRRRATTTSSLAEAVRSAVRAATTAAEDQASSSSGRPSATAGLPPHTVRAVIAAEQAQDSDEEITVIAVKRPLSGVVKKKRSESAAAKHPPKTSGQVVAYEDLTTEPDTE